MPFCYRAMSKGTYCNFWFFFISQLRAFMLADMLKGERVDCVPLSTIYVNTPPFSVICQNPNLQLPFISYYWADSRIVASQCLCSIVLHSPYNLFPLPPSPIFKRCYCYARVCHAMSHTPKDYQGCQTETSLFPHRPRHSVRYVFYVYTHRHLDLIVAGAAN